MSAKKTEVIHIRFTEEEKRELEQLAKAKKTNVSKMMGEITKDLLLAYRQHGKRLIWPPEFDHFPAEAQTASEIRRAAEKTPKQNVA